MKSLLGMRWFVITFGEIGMTGQKLQLPQGSCSDRHCWVSSCGEHMLNMQNVKHCLTMASELQRTHVFIFSLCLFRNKIVVWICLFFHGRAILKFMHPLKVRKLWSNPEYSGSGLACTCHVIRLNITVGHRTKSVSLLACHAAVIALRDTDPSEIHSDTREHAQGCLVSFLQSLLLEASIMCLRRTGVQIFSQQLPSLEIFYLQSVVG